MTRTQHQLTRDRVRLHNQIESFLEDAHIKLSGWDLLGVSSRRILKALSLGETDVTKLAALADPALRATPEQLQGRTQRRSHAGSLASALQHYHDAVERLAEVPGYGIDSAHQVIAEVSAGADSFPSPEQLSSWGGDLPGPGGIRRGVHEQSQPQGKSDDAAGSDSGRQRRRQDQGQCVSESVP